MSLWSTESGKHVREHEWDSYPWSLTKNLDNPKLIDYTEQKTNSEERRTASLSPIASVAVIGHLNLL